MSQGNARNFWNKEYKDPQYFALSHEPSGDLEKFARWLFRNKRENLLSKYGFVVDAGCGNGRNLIYLAKNFGVKGIGYDLSDVAIAQAKEHGFGLPVTFSVGDINDPIPAQDESADIVLDLMSSHYLDQAGRERFKQEVLRVLKPGGFFLMKSFLASGDIHTKKLLEGKQKGKTIKQGKEKGTYVHPLIGAEEHTWTEQEVEDFWTDNFTLAKFEKSFGHLAHGRANKRRYFVAYLEKKY